MDLFFPTRIARLSYIARSVVLTAVLYPFTLGASDDTGGPHGAVSTWKVLVALLIIGYWIVFVVLPRCRDLNLSRWEKILLFIPPIGLPLWGRLTWSSSRPFLDAPVGAPSSTSPPPSPSSIPPPVATVPQIGRAHV